MKIATWNVNGIRARAEQVAGWLASEKPDVACLQEIKALPSQVPALLFEPGEYWTKWHGGGGYSGVALLVSKALAAAEPAWAHPAFDHENRIVTAEVGPVTVASVYVPNGGKDMDAKMRFLESLRQWAAGVQGPLIVCGDLNVARAEIDVYPKDRKPTAIGQTPAERELFARLLETGLADVQRKLYPDTPELYTWWAPWRNLRERNMGWRIDYVLASEGVAVKARECKVFRETGTSDHAPLVAEFEL
ncbi:MAG: exodeoxyribonuclease III [Bryobacteraceae bacterium]|nr:exodeoxyribonuclease III [Bryobacteraceae bacterium]